MTKKLSWNAYWKLLILINGIKNQSVVSKISVFFFNMLQEMGGRDHKCSVFKYFICFRVSFLDKLRISYMFLGWTLRQKPMTFCESFLHLCFCPDSSLTWHVWCAQSCALRAQRGTTGQRRRIPISTAHRGHWLCSVHVACCSMLTLSLSLFRGS